MLTNFHEFKKIPEYHTILHVLRQTAFHESLIYADHRTKIQLRLSMILESHGTGDFSASARNVHS